MYDGNVLQDLLKRENNKPLRGVFRYSTAEERFEELLRIRPHADKEAYAMYVRMVLQVDTHNVPTKILLDALHELTPKDLMSKFELDELEKLPKSLTIYRGTDMSEKEPRVSWSLSKETAMRFYRGRLFCANVKKNEIFAYFSKNCDETEILAYVTDSYSIVL